MWLSRGQGVDGPRSATNCTTEWPASKSKCSCPPPLHPWPVTRLPSLLSLYSQWVYSEVMIALYQAKRLGIKGQLFFINNVLPHLPALFFQTKGPELSDNLEHMKNIFRVHMPFHNGCVYFTIQQPNTKNLLVLRGRWGRCLFSLRFYHICNLLLLPFYKSRPSHVRCVESKVQIPVVPPSEVKVTRDWQKQSQDGVSLQDHEIQVILLNMQKGLTSS